MWLRVLYLQRPLVSGDEIVLTGASLFCEEFEELSVPVWKGDKEHFYHSDTNLYWNYFMQLFEQIRPRRHFDVLAKDVQKVNSNNSQVALKS